MNGSLVFGFIAILFAFIVAIISWRKIKSTKKYYETFVNEFIYTADFNGLNRIETIANKYKEFNKENSKETSKLKLKIICDILDKVEFCRTMRTTALASQEIKEVDKLKEQIEQKAAEVEKAEKPKKNKTKKEVVN